MKKMSILVLVLFASIITLSIPAYAQCSGHGSSSGAGDHSQHSQQSSVPDTVYWGKGRSVNSIELQSIKILLTNKEEYLGKIIVLKGKISSECPSGHWFYFEDNSTTDKIYVSPAGFVLPQITGVNVRVYGTWAKQNEKWLIEAKRVELALK